LHFEFVEAEERKVGEDAIDDAVLGVGADGVEGKEFLDENFDEIFVTDAAVEDLLDKYFLVRIFALNGLHCNWLTLDKKESAWESMVVTIGLNVEMHSVAF
jgi:hypothetical protein